MSPLAHIRRSSHNRLVALLALVALLLASTAYVAHGYTHDKPFSPHTSAQCDLCLHFSGTASAPDQPAYLGILPPEVSAPAAFETPPLCSHKHPTNRLPRAPPALT
jgi:hypothetical protein